eukprot:TRINITY_DN5966_c0_g1_i1.p1 TRINITY_DN5966_c0_g1~~TRINITY_DN5966_c0_g1_i1.p1  ORF type:complete len:510 (+),score=99.88 TRINITY_DN5966_c0_g1_i1:30-1532(+)
MCIRDRYMGNMEKKISTEGIKVDVTEYVEKQAPEAAVFFKIAASYKGVTWNVEKRFSEFDALHKELTKTFMSVPDRPPKTVFKIKSAAGLQKRTQELNVFIKALSSRLDIMEHGIMRKFLDFEKNTKESAPALPFKVFELGPLPLGARDFWYAEEQGLLFVALSNMDLASRLDAYLSNISLPWSKKEEIAITVGALMVYSVTKESDLKDWNFKLLWVKGYSVQTNVILWCPTLSILEIGLDDGFVRCLKIPMEEKGLKHEELGSLQMHKARVMGLAIDPATKASISIGEDGKIKIFDITTLKVFSEIAPSDAPLKCLEYNEEMKRVFVANGVGELYIYAFSETKLDLLTKIYLGSTKIIRGLAVCYKTKKVFTSALDGVISIIDLGGVGEEKSTKLSNIIKGPEKARFLQWNLQNQELISGYENGQIILWNPETKAMKKSFLPHAEAITKILWDEKKKLLITAAKDKYIKAWNLPIEIAKEVKAESESVLESSPGALLIN